MNELTNSENVQIENFVHGLKQLWDEPLIYIKQYAEALDSVNEAYFISYFINITEPGQWLLLNPSLIENEIGLSSGQWRLVRENLIAKDILLSRRIAGTVHGIEYLLNDEKLETLLANSTDLDVRNIACPPLTINKLQVKALTALGLNISSIILMALIQEIVGNVAINEREDFSAWVYLSDLTITSRTYINRRTSNRALNALIECGIIETKLANTPPVRQVRYSLKVLGELTMLFANGSK